MLKRKTNQEKKKKIAGFMFSLDSLQASPQSRDGPTSKLYFPSIFYLQISWLFTKGRIGKILQPPWARDGRKTLSWRKGFPKVIETVLAAARI